MNFAPVAGHQEDDFDEQSDVQLRNLNQHQGDAPLETSTSSATNFSQEVDQIVDLANALRRHSPRLAGESPLPGLPNKTRH
jgi:hypothetical protein